MNLNPEHIKVSLVQADHEKNLGQWSMQTYSGVVIYHEPTKTMASCTKHRSQWKNKCEAMKILESKITEPVVNVNLTFITGKLAELKSSLGRYKSLTLEDYDILYGDVEEIQYLLSEVTDENTTNL